MADDAGQSKRGDKRDTFFLSGTVTFGDQQTMITRVRNLSTGGMMIDAPFEMVPGTRLTVELRGVGLIEGRVAWASAGKAGVAFDEDIDPRLARTPPSAKSRVPEYLKSMPGRRPGLAVR